MSSLLHVRRQSAWGRRFCSREVCGALLLDVGLVLMLFSYLFVYGLGREAFVFAAAGGPMLLLGIWLDRTWPRVAAFSVGMAIGCSWIYFALAW